MKADIKKLKSCDKTHKYRKEKGFYRQITMIDSRDGSAIVTARFYWPGRDGASRCYACIWINGDSVYGHAGGYAGGYGYHKESAALSDAIGRAGVTLTEGIAGRGDSAMRDALQAIARASINGNRRIFRSESHA